MHGETVKNKLVVLEQCRIRVFRNGADEDSSFVRCYAIQRIP